MSRFRDGDVCVINNDNYKGGHPYDKGTIVTLIQLDGGAEPVWQCEDAQGERWWVQEGCLDLADKGPSDTEVLELFGIIPQPHCPTCTCREEET